MKIIQKRRRIEGKTNYARRIKMLRGEFPRIVFRKSNKYIIGQYIESNESQDIVSVGVNSKKLIDYGWPKDWKGSLKSIPASYMTGFLLGNMVIGMDKNKNVIFDLGVYSNVHKSRIYAFLKGAIDSGLEIKHNKKVFPEDQRLKGVHIKKDIEKVIISMKEKIKHG